MSYKGNPKVYFNNVTGHPYLLRYLKGVPINIVVMAVAGAHRNLKVLEYYFLGSHSQVWSLHMVLKEEVK